MKVILLATLATFVITAAYSPAAAQDPPPEENPATAAQDPLRRDQDPPPPLDVTLQEMLNRLATRVLGSPLSPEQVGALREWLAERQQRQAVLGVIATDAAELRESPPYGPLNLFIGHEIQADVGRGTVVEIVDEKRIGTFTGREVWYAIRPLDSTIHHTNDRELWINAGTEGIGGQTPGVIVAALW